MPGLSRVSDAADEAMSIKYNTRVYELKRQGVSVTVMSLGEAFFDLPLFPFGDLPYPDLYHYSDSRGIPRLREQLAGYLRKHHAVIADKDSEILITSGSKAAIHMALMAILDPGDEVIIHEPAWVSYPEQVKLCYGVPVPVPYDRSVDDFERYIGSRTKAIVINNPNNPRGYVFQEAELRRLLALAGKHGIWVLADEAYSEFVSPGDGFVSMGAIDRDRRSSIVCNSLSKNLGISGWRIGYVVAARPIIYNILKINQHLITCPATVLEHYVAAHFDELHETARPQIEALLERRRTLACHMDRIGLEHLPGTATFYFFVSIASSRLSSEAFCTRLLEEDHVSIVPGLGYGLSCDRFVRVSIGSTTLEEAIFGLDRIKRLIEVSSADGRP